MQRVVIFGHNSFIARHLAQAAQKAGMALLALPHDADPGCIRSGDLVVNCAYHPALRSGAYDRALDMDALVAEAAAAAGAHFTMLSTRRVYPEQVRWGATENAAADGDETAYGRNKAQSEQAVAELTRGRASILRLSNIIGPEFDGIAPRNTFIGKLLWDLHTKSKIEFAMHPDTRKDFLPVPACVKAILTVSQRKLPGIVNVGCGFPVRCGDLADWIMVGSGGGLLEVMQQGVRDEFFLDTGKWRSLFPPLVTADDLKAYCVELGWGIRHA